MSVVTNVAEVTRSANLIKQLTIRDLKLRYERSALGFVWSLLNPLVMIAIYTFFFSIVVRMGVERYPVFLVSVLLPWNFLMRSVLSVSPQPHQNGYLLNRAAFPSECIVFSGMLSAFVDFCLEMLVFIVLLLAFGVPVFPGLAIIPLAVVLHFMFAAGVALIFSVAFVYYRDTQYVAGILTTAWLYLTPVFYPVSKVPEQFQMFYNLNPMVHMAELFRVPLYTGQFPGLTQIGIAGLVAVSIFLLGWAFYNRYKGDFAEVL